jgi:SAM-dependent methyltransferase
VPDQAHWDRRYQDVGAESVSWYQERPTTSLELFEVLGVDSTRSVLDVGGGASRLVDFLVGGAYGDVAVLDLSGVALEVARARLGDPAGVEWVHHELTSWRPPRRWDVWHDRAVLHFLVAEEDRTAYRRVLREALSPGGAVVIGTFAEDGPSHCSGLPVRRHSRAELCAFLGDGFEVVEQRREVHRTPAGTEQPFNWIAARDVRR